MSESEKTVWLSVILMAWFPVIAVFVLYEVTGMQTPQDGSVGRYFLNTFAIWALTLAFRNVYLWGKRKAER